MRMKMQILLRLYFPISIFVFIGLCGVQGQNLYTKIHIGAMYYHGDLTPRTIGLSTGPARFSWGATLGSNVTDWASINARFMNGRLTGDDRFSLDETRKSRNLNFTTPIYEFGIYTDLKVNKLIKRLDKYKVRLYITAGLNFFRFNPSTTYQGRSVALQPIGTEGQTMSTNDKKPYSLTAISRPIGIAIEFDLTKKISIGIEAAPRKTFTDYIDDVSGTYVNYDEMMAAGNYLGAQLSNRTGEYFGTDNARVPTGTLRGNPSQNDWYTHFGFYFKYSFIKNSNSESPKNNDIIDGIINN